MHHYISFLEKAKTLFKKQEPEKHTYLFRADFSEFKHGGNIPC